MVSKKHSTFAAHLEKCRGKTSCGNSSVGRAPPCQGWGREFESRFPLHILNNTSCCPGGGIGRRARFRCVCLTACRFESCSGHILFGMQFMMERWRNWETRYFEGVVKIASWEVESPPLHIL